MRVEKRLFDCLHKFITIFFFLNRGEEEEEEVKEAKEAKEK